MDNFKEIHINLWPFSIASCLFTNINIYHYKTIFIIYIYIYVHIWVNYNDLTATLLGILVNKGNHPFLWPNYSGQCIVMIYIYIYINHKEHNIWVNDMISRYIPTQIIYYSLLYYIYIYIYTYILTIYIYIHTMNNYIYIYTYKERERERENYQPSLNGQDPPCRPLDREASAMRPSCGGIVARRAAEGEHPWPVVVKVEIPMEKLQENGGFSVFYGLFMGF